MKNKIIYLLLATILNLNAQKQQQRPKLVVGIVVDQMKMEYLYRFNNDFSEKGFKRLMDNGYVYHNMHINYLPSYTAPGHASIYTGATPSVHGIVGNEWFSKKLGKNIYCTDDSSVKTLGNGTETEGLMSPKNLLSTTITDELKLATNFRGKVIGMSLKDRGAILPAGHFANWAFWYSETGAFISSSFYGEKLPDWVTNFNNEKRFMNYINNGWNLLKSPETYDESLPDINPYEGKISSGVPSLFPYNLKEIYAKSNAGILRAVPFGNDLLIDFAKKAIENEVLGKDDITDFLTISFSSPDYIGHTIGPRSRELQDTYLRLDLSIANFMTYLDHKVGKDNYLLFLTADHAGAENANYLKDKKYEVKSIEPDEIHNGLIKFSNQTFGENLVLDYSNFNLFLDLPRIKMKGLDLKMIIQSFKNYLLTQEQVKMAYTEDEIVTSNGSDYYLDLIRNGYDLQENGQIIVLDKPGYMEYKDTGTTHGTPYNYDTHIPLIFYGWNVSSGECFNRKTVNQIAPTLAQKIKIEFPNGSTSEVLSEVLESD